MATPEHQRLLREGVNKELDRYIFPNVGANGLRTLSFQDTCLFRGVVGGVMGGAFGAVFSVLMSTMTPPNMAPNATPGMGGMGGMGMGMGVNPMNPVASTGSVRPPAAIPHATASTLVASSIHAATAASASASAAAASSLPPSNAIASVAVSSAVSSSLPRAALIGPQPLPPVAPIAVTPMDPIYGGQSPLETTSWQQVKDMARDTGRQAKSSFKTWGIMSGTYATSECLIETVRGKSDDWNPIMAGCSTGAFLAARSGPSGMAFGCAGFASFSYAMEKVMHRFG